MIFTEALDGRKTLQISANESFIMERYVLHLNDAEVVGEMDNYSFLTYSFDYKPLVGDFSALFLKSKLATVVCRSAQLRVMRLKCSSLATQL